MAALLSALFLFFALPGIAPHPHVPKVLKVGGAAGDLAFRYFTVPYNEEHLEGLEAGFQWHLGFASVESEVPFTFGGAEIPAGTFKLDAVRGESADDWSIRLVPTAVWGAARRGAEALEAATAAAVEQGLKAAYDVDTRCELLHEAEEHLEFEVALRGYRAVDTRQWKPAAGVTGSFRLVFGKWRLEAAFAETFEPSEEGR